MPPLIPKAKTDEWETPDWLFSRYNEMYNFSLDVCASPINAKCKKYNSETEPDKHEWTGESCWMNPPYDHKSLYMWTYRANVETHHRRADIVVGLLPAKTDQEWWHTHVIGVAAEVTFIRGRVHFVGGNGGAGFPSVVVVWAPDFHGDTVFNTLEK